MRNFTRIWIPAPPREVKKKHKSAPRSGLHSIHFPENERSNQHVDWWPQHHAAGGETVFLLRTSFGLYSFGSVKMNPFACANRLFAGSSVGWYRAVQSRGKRREQTDEKASSRSGRPFIAPRNSQSTRYAELASSALISQVRVMPIQMILHPDGRRDKRLCLHNIEI